MPHVDEGTLHALIDGALDSGDPGAADDARAHLALCADCRARLEEAADLARRASGILTAAGPDAAPDFDEVLIRADRTGAERERRRRRARTTRGVAWAATVVLALGTGYLIRDLTAPAPASFPAVEARGAAEPAEPGAEDVLPAPPPAPMAEAAPPQAPRPAAPRREEPAAEVAAGPEPRPERALDEVASAPVTVTGAGVRLEEAARRDVTAGAAAAAFAERAPDLAHQAAGRSARLGLDEAPLLSAAEAADRAGGVLWVLAGAVVLEAWVTGTGDALEVHSRQRTAAGEDVRVRQRSVEAADDAAADDAAADGAAVTVRRGDHLLTLSGPLTPETLRSLAESAEPLSSAPR